MTSRLAGLFLAAFVAATLLPTSSEFVLASILLAHPERLWPAVAVASLGNRLGAVVNWLLGRFLGHLVSRSWFPLSPEGHARAVGWFHRFGLWSLAFALLPIVGDPLTVVAGMLRVGFAPFFVLVALGKTARYVTIALLAV